MFWHLGERRIVQELMDEADPKDARECLKDLIRINTVLGGHRIVRHMLARAGCREREAFSILDVGAASGDTADVIRQAYPNATVVSLDRNEVNLGAAQGSKVLADAFQLPFAPRSFDFVMCSLFLHHFRNDQVLKLIQGFAAVARNAVLISDLERHIAPYLFLPASRPVFGWHWMTIHDGRISVRAAFRKAELKNLAEHAGLQQVRVETHRPAFRLSLIGKTQP
jgi:SAM-dependent methyltransferase